MQLQFNAQTVQPSQPMEPIPDGWYPCIVKSTEPKKVTGSETKWYVNFEHEIIDGPFRGRKVFNNLNLGNDNQQAVDIAYRDLSAMCHVTGRYVINDTNELCNIPFQIKVTVEGSQNRIKGYKDAAGNDPGKTGAQAGAGQPAAAAMPPAGAPAGYGGAPAAAAPAWGGAAAPAQAPAYAAPAAAPAYAPAAAPAWGGGAATAPAQAPAAAPAWTPPAGNAAPAGGAAPWQR